MHKEISGVEFNTIYEGIKFYKFLNDDLTHYGFKYQLGLNVDVIPFTPSNSCSKGGLHFCEKKYCYEYFAGYGELLAVIEIPNDARIYVDEYKFKADKLIIKSITNFKDISDDFWSFIDSKYYDNIYSGLKFVKEQIASQRELYKLVVCHHGSALEYITERLQTEEICKLAVQQNGLALKYVKEQFLTEEICRIAVRQNGLAIQYVDNNILTEELCRLAVQSKIIFGQQNSNVLWYVREQFQTEEICKLAILQNVYAVKYVSGNILREKMYEFAAQQNYLISNLENKEVHV